MRHEFRDPLALGRIVRVAIAAFLCTTLANAAANVFTVQRIGAYQAGSGGMEDLRRVDSVTSIVAITSVLVLLVTMVLVARWIYRTNKNAHNLSDAMTISPGWSVGWFFISVACLWKPLQGIRETWRASVLQDDPARGETPSWVTTWWVVWVASNILSNISFRLSLGDKALDGIVATSWIDLVTAPFDLLAGVLLWLLVKRLSQLQHAVALDRDGPVAPGDRAEDLPGDPEDPPGIPLALR